MNAAVIIALLSSCTVTRTCTRTSKTSVKAQKSKPASTKQVIPKKRKRVFATTRNTLECVFEKNALEGVDG